MLARTASVCLVVAVLTASCGDLRTTETPRTVETSSPEPTTLSLSQLLRSGRLRAAFPRPNITCVRTNSRGATGLCVDIAHELAAQMQVALVDSQFDSASLMFDAGRHGDWDVAFVNLDVNFPQPGIIYTPPYLVLDQTYLVPGTSPYQSVADVDRPGIRVATFSPSPIEGVLKQNLKYAVVVDVPSIAHGVQLIEQGQADVYAASRAELVEGGWRLAGGRVLDDSVTRIRWGIAIASGRVDLLAYVTQFLDSGKRNGVIQDAIDKNKVAGAHIVR